MRLACPASPLSSLKKMTAYIATHKHQNSHQISCNRNLLWKEKKERTFSLDVAGLFSFLNVAYATLISTARGIYVQPIYCYIHLEAEICLWYCRRAHFGALFQKAICFFLFVIERSFVICQCLSFPLYFADFQYLLFSQVWCWMTNKSSPCSKLGCFLKEVCTFP